MLFCCVLLARVFAWTTEYFITYILLKVFLSSNVGPVKMKNNSRILLPAEKNPIPNWYTYYGIWSWLISILTNFGADLL